MACESAGKNERRVNQFNKIRLLNDIANQIGFYGVQNGNETLMDKIDLSCGAVPDGEFEQVIDLNAPHQFLELYMQIAENRFAMAVTELLKMNPAFFAPVKEFCERVGRDMKISGIDSIDQVMEVYESFVLDGMPCDETKEITERTADLIIWKKLYDSHQKAWEKAGGTVSNYYELQKAFVNGLVSSCGFEYKIENDEIFSLRKL